MDVILFPFLAYVKEGAEVVESYEELMVTDAKFIYDSLSEGHSPSKADRRTAVELAIIQAALESRESRIRWIPHPLNPVEVMTKSDVGKGSSAFTNMLRTGRVKLLASEQDEIECRRNPGAKPCRSQAESHRLLEQQNQQE